MDDTTARIAALAADLVRIDSRSSVSNLAVADRLEQALPGFTIERGDYDDGGVTKRVLVAHRGPLRPGLALSGHMDTVPDTGWTTDPWSARIDQDGIMHGLGTTDMKGQVAAAVIAAQDLPADVPITLLITSDEETTKAGARKIVASDLARRVAPKGILVVEATGLRPIRGHRSHIEFRAVARGVQAHSSSADGRNANWDLIPFLVEMRTIFHRLRNDPALQDPAYDPPFSDFNLIVDNHGTAVNVTVPVATARIKFRFSRGLDPTPVIESVRAAAARAGIDLEEKREGSPPELPADHPFVRLVAAETGLDPGTAPYGTDASELQALAPCVVCGPGTITTAHTPEERVSLAELAAAVPLFRRLARAMAA